MVQGQGNFGSIDGDSAAAMRYTEARLSRVGEALLEDIDKNTVNFVENYNGTRKEPSVLPCPLPQLLLNGSLGIAVGMATNIPPHNLGEVSDALVYLLDNPKATTEDLFQFIKGPDFPLGGEIFDKSAILAAYSQGKGPIVTRGKADIVHLEKNDRYQIIITEIPLPGAKIQPFGADRQPGDRKKDRRHQRRARRIGQGRHARSDRSSQRRLSAKGFEPFIQIHRSATDISI